MYMNSMDEMLMPMIAAMSTVIIIALFVLLFNRIVMGIFCRKLAGRKGYAGYFWTGFFFGLIGLVYIVGLPDLNIRKDMRAVMKRMVSVNDRVEAFEGNARAQQY